MRIVKGTPVKSIKDLTDIVSLNLKVDNKVVQDVIKFKLDFCKKIIMDPTYILPHVGVKFSTLGTFRMELESTNHYIRNVLLPHLRMAKAHKSKNYQQDCQTFKRIWILRQYLIKNSSSLRPYPRYIATAINEKL